ncbi:hypothetical protein BJF79_22230 [Actinomadura sp. CNU-125]|nr:hypothetical protein BJF79_22230 [Actinomadura sp. CNU-125]
MPSANPTLSTSTPSPPAGAGAVSRTVCSACPPAVITAGETLVEATCGPVSAAADGAAAKAAGSRSAEAAAPRPARRRIFICDMPPKVMTAGPTWENEDRYVRGP